MRKNEVNPIYLFLIIDSFQNRTALNIIYKTNLEDLSTSVLDDR